MAALLAFGGLLVGGGAARAQDADRQLLATFCAAADIKGKACKRARGYAGGKACDVELQPDRYRGKFLADGTMLLVVNYTSGCEPHATDFGGSVMFEQKGGALAFKGYQPGMQVNDCVALPRNDNQDRLICATGHIGQGHLESGVAEMVFKRDAAKKIEVDYNFFVNAEDSTGAYGSNVVECKETRKFFGVARPVAGPRRDTVSVEFTYADKETIETACGKGFPRPKETFGELSTGEAYVPPGFEKKGRFVIDLTNSRVTPQAETAKL